jgi:hypothetical protein
MPKKSGFDYSERDVGKGKRTPGKIVEQQEKAMLLLKKQAEARRLCVERKELQKRQEDAEARQKARDAEEAKKVQGQNRDYLLHCVKTGNYDHVCHWNQLGFRCMMRFCDKEHSKANPLLPIKVTQWCSDSFCTSQTCPHNHADERNPCKFDGDHPPCSKDWNGCTHVDKGCTFHHWCRHQLAHGKCMVDGCRMQHWEVKAPEVPGFDNTDEFPAPQKCH